MWVWGGDISSSVLQVCLSKAEGGLELSTFKIAKFFKEQGHQSVTLCLKNSFLEKKLSETGLDSISVPRKEYFSPHIIRVLSRANQKYQFRAVFVHQLRDLWHTYWLKRKNPDIKIYGYARMFLYGVNKKDFLHRKIYGQLEKLLVLSESQIPTLLECLPVPKEKFLTIPNGINLAQFFPKDRTSSIVQNIRKELGAISNTEKLIGLIGRLDFQKGHREFVDAARILKPKFPGARFVMIGSGTEGQTEFESEIRNKIKGDDLSETVRLLKFRADIPDVMNALDVFVLPSYNEAFGNVLLEAMACKTPCIGTNIGGIPELLGNGEYGTLVKSESGMALASGIERVLENYNTYKAVSDKAYQRVLAKYDSRIVYKNLEALVSS